MRARFARSENVEVISKVARMTVHRSLDHLVRPSVLTRTGVPITTALAFRMEALPLLLLFLSRFTRQHFGCHELPISFSVNLQLGQSAYTCIA